MNGLKLINDVFGHDMGDLLLEKVGIVLKESCREPDIIARGAIFLLCFVINTASEVIADTAAHNSFGVISTLIILGTTVQASINSNKCQHRKVPETLDDLRMRKTRM